MKYDTENNLLRLKTEKTHENVLFYALTYKLRLHFQINNISLNKAL